MNQRWVLLLEDDAELRETLEAGLRRAGLTVRCASDGAEALRMFEEHPVPSVVLSDLMVPGVLGQSVLEYMRGEPTLCDIPVAIITGSPEQAPSGYRVFAKPVPFGDVLAFVNQALDASATIA